MKVFLALLGGCYLVVAVQLMAQAAGTPALQERGVIAKNYQYLPEKIILKKGVPAKLYFTSIDRPHDVHFERLNMKGKVIPGKITVLSFTPEVAGVFEYACDVYCGPGHETMKAKIVVSEDEN